MRYASSNLLAGRSHSLSVEWHDCSWTPVIVPPSGVEIYWVKPIKPLPQTAILSHPVRRQNFFMPMKTKLSSPRAMRQGFTLVELLVVIAIIGILAAMLMPALIGAKKAAQKVKAKTEMADIVNAIQAYDQDYSRFPVSKDEQTWLSANGGGDLTVGMVFGSGPYSMFNNSNAVAILMDLTTYPNTTATCNANHVKNPKQVKYLNAKLSGYDPINNPDPNPPGGVDATGVYRDPWGNPYVITMNTSYNEQGTTNLLYALQSVSQVTAGKPEGYNGLFNPASNPDTDNYSYHGKVMVWSAGPDKAYDTGKSNSGKNKDNVLSWQ